MSTLSQFRLNGKVSVITGGYGYLGRHISEGLFEAGATVIVGGRSVEKYHHVFGKKKSKNIAFAELDVSSVPSIKAAFKTIHDRYGSIDILINNAFYSRGNSPEQMSDEEWEYGIDGTLSSVFRCMREVIPYMKLVRKGNIINISSMYGVVSPDFWVYENNAKFLNPPHYGAAKAGVIQLTKYYAAYLAKSNIRVNCVCPGAFPSLEVQKSKDFVKKLSKKVPMGRIGNPTELKGIFIFLASEASSYITGQHIAVDGGWTIC